MAKQTKKRILLLLLSLLLLFSGTGALTSCTTSSSGNVQSPTAPVFSFYGDGRALSPFSSVSVVSSLATATSPSSTSELTKDLKLYVGGMPFGVKFITEGVLVVGFCDVNTAEGSINPSLRAGLKVNDVITKINGAPISGASELTTLVEGSGGAPLTLTYRRGGKEGIASLSPALSREEGKYKSGIYVRDSGAGIGTVTFIHPADYSFAGLGHGICDGETGKLIPMQRGSVVNVTISGVVRGLVGAPGEVKGYFNSGKVGSLLKNTECGVYGIFAEPPTTIHGSPVSVGNRNELREGEAEIYCTLDSNKIEKYKIQISSIDRTATGNKCFTVKITDEKLLAKTGGIIQGMSGSPIIQNGKLVGAVTHVLVNDPTTGYGIFIENMLGAAQMPMARAS